MVIKIKKIKNSLSHQLPPFAVVSVFVFLIFVSFVGCVVVIIILFFGESSK